jgi:hypothetical protein
MEDTEQPLVLPQRDPEARPCIVQFDRSYPQRIAPSIGLVFGDIHDVDDLLATGDAA